MKTIKVLIAVFLAWGLIGSAIADHHKKGEQSVFQATFLGSYSAETDKLVSLVEEFSEKGFEWRPAEGIRSVHEAVLHVATANYGIGSRFLGKAMPEGLNPRELGKTVKTREEAIVVLKDSIQFVKEAVGTLDDAALAEPIKLFGSDSNRMGAVLVLGGHAYEHLGQLIAYARSSGVVPPWSQ
ncbi:MAG: DinB family protein [Opitutaceae bacterium]|nr:DinB family protein [Opitutaceae bacterium]